MNDELFTILRVPFYAAVSVMWAGLLLAVMRAQLNGARQATMYLVVAVAIWPIMLGLMAVTNLLSDWTGRELVTVALLVNFVCGILVYRQLDLL